MSAVVDLVDDIVRDIPIVNVQWELIKDVHDGLWQEIGKPTLEFIFSLLGIEDEDIVSAQVVTQRIINEDIASNILSRVALDHQAEPDSGIIEHMTLATNRIKGKYAGYFYQGENDYFAGLPNTTIRGTTVNYALVEQAINEGLGPFNDVEMVSATYRVPTKEEYTAWYLRWVLGNDFQAWDFTWKDPTFTYPNERYTVQTITYIFLTDTYDVTYELKDDVTTTTSTRTTITITNIDATTDNKNTLVEEIVVKTSPLQGEFYNVTTTVSDTDEVIPIGTEADSVNTVVDSVVVSPVTIDSGILNIPAYAPVGHFIGKFAYSASGTADVNEFNYFLYEPSTDTHPYLSAASTYTTNLEMLPIVELRNNAVSVTADKLSTKYRQTKEILGVLGIDVDEFVKGIEDNASIDDVMDAYIYFAVEPNDSHPIVSRALYDMFSFVYDDSSLYTPPTSELVDDGGYTVVTTEGAFNATIAWKTQTKAVVNGSIGPVNTYQHSVDSVGRSLTIRKQETEGAYVEYTFNLMTSLTLVDRGGLVGSTSVALGDDGFVIPLSQFFVDQLTPLEQTILFTKSLHLSVYAAAITHLEYYETETFAVFIQIVAIVVAIVLAVLGVPTDPTLVAAYWASVATTVAVSIAVTYALKFIFESTDNDIARALAVAAAIATIYYTGNADGLADLGLITANTLSQAVQIDVKLEMERLQDKANKFNQAVEQRAKRLEEARKAQEGYMSIGEVVELKTREVPQAYIEGIDAFMFRAKGDIQYQWDMCFNMYDRKVSSFYDDMYRTDVNRPLS